MVKQKAPHVEMRNIHKSFGDVQALRGVDFTVYENEVVGLVGDNGAGKSTLVKILTGIYQPDKGEIYYRGQKIKLSSPVEAHALGIEPVHQSGATIDEIAVWENFFLGRELVRKFFFIKLLDKRQMRYITQETLNKLGIELDSVDRPMGTLSGGQRQAVVIGRASYFGGELLVLDEPTAALSLKETERVLKYIEGVKKLGHSVILISHLTLHVYPIADRFVILDRGEKIGDFPKEQISRKELEEIIVRGRMATEVS
ncbi:MAG: simple sugar transport system ATP-binding protein [Candidatus Atribacteria bacterium]|nr:simple sugar transport system ATP-binding protein [Candidatus Atribacteria bacterium]